MTTERAALAALVLYGLGLFGAFAVRAWVHRRATGSAGYRGLSGAPGSAPWWGGILFVAALVLGAAGPALAVVEAVPAAVALPAALPWTGVGLMALGSLGVLAAQAGMGSSWRIGVDPAERTDLVTTGAFAVVRNPIFTAMIAALVGLVLLVPTVVTAAALACLAIAVEVQVRAVEEPYLRRVHGEAYARYTDRVGRFAPRIARRP
ncbi:methyltransferase family protein [Georgenia faecalis]|uniref:Methyltransferase family protein n=1 Tax=Georgenia faecalis TaxID=2483799 RepID=A0ABV9D9J1_9MICO|nr:isoprenylcysteine carboxylmethyltransferase family protein [Georgenia faecalis]